MTVKELTPNTKSENNVQTDSSDSDDSDCEIKITLNPVDFSKMTDEEREAYFKKYETCAYCQSIGKDERVYKGHTKETCKILQNTRCNWCGGYGHTGKYCQNRGEKPLDIRCMFCFRAKMDERFYMSHTPDRCRFKREYDDAKRDGRPIPTRPRGTQQPRIIEKPPKPLAEPKKNASVAEPENSDELYKILLAMKDDLIKPKSINCEYDPALTVPGAYGSSYREYDPALPVPGAYGSSYQEYDPTLPVPGAYGNSYREYDPTLPVPGAYGSSYQEYAPALPVPVAYSRTDITKVQNDDTIELLNRLKKENEKMLSKLSFKRD
jgi:hypothetical protein